MRRLLALSTAAFVVAACNGGGPAAPTALPPFGQGAFTVSGTVADAELGRPISDAQVELAEGSESRSAASDSGGFYAVRGLPSGTWNVTVSRVGFESQYVRVEVTKDTTLSFELTRLPGKPPKPSF